MKMFNTKLKKTATIIACALVIVLALIFIFSSYIAKYLIEKYAVKYTGREITLDYAYVNLFTGFVYLNNLEIKECGSDSIFLAAEGASGKFNLRKLFHRTCEITDLKLNHARGIIIQAPDGVNYRDLVERFKPTDTIPSTSSFHFRILGIKINDGILSYRETTIPINYSVIHLNIESPGFGWNMDTLAAKISLVSGNGGGGIKGFIAINLPNMDYTMDATIDKLELKFLEQYFKVISNYGSFRANLDASLNVKGNFKDADSLHVRGAVFIDDFHFGETPARDFASFEKFALHINLINPKNKEYLLDSISLSHPYFKLEHYDYLDNIQLMFGKKGNIVASVKHDPEQFNLILVIGDYIKTITRNFFKSTYNVNRVAIYNGDFKYNDYSLNEKFSIEASPLSVIADSIKRNKSSMHFHIKSGIKPYGTAYLNLNVNPKDSSDYYLSYNLQRMPISLFNPYSISYTSFPLDRGTLELEGSWKVKNGIIQSTNHLLIIDARVADKVKNKNNKWIPMKLAMFFLRDRENVMDYKIPITGNSKAPDFHLGNIILNIIRNILVKPPTTIYRIDVKNTETEIENALVLKWRMRQSSLLPRQVKFLKKLAVLLSDTSSLSISVHPMLYAEKEKEYILLFEAKKKYFLNLNHRHDESLNKNDSLSIERMSNKDSLFINYLNKKVGKNKLFTIQDKCTALLGASYITEKYNRLNEARTTAFNSCFQEKALKKHIKICAKEDVIPYNGYSYYKIEYKGYMPPSLLQAYKQMSKYNNEPPRKKFKEKRDKNSQYSKE